MPAGGWACSRADKGQLRNKALSGPLLGRLSLTSLIKSWGRGAPGEEGCIVSRELVRSAEEVGRGLGRRGLLVYFWGRPRLLA